MKLSIEELPEGYEARYAAAGDIIGEAKAAASAIQDEAAYNLNAAYGPRETGRRLGLSHTRVLARVKRHEGRTSGTFFFPWAVRDHIRAALTGTDSEDLVGLFDAGDWVTLTLAQAERALMTNYREGDPAWVEHNQARAALREAVAELKEKALWRRHYAQLRSMGVYAYSDERGNRHTLQVLGVDPGYRQNAQIPFSEVVEAAKAAGAPMSGWRDAV